MTRTKGWKQKLAKIQKLLGNERYDEALSHAEELLGKWPGNPRLLTLWAELVQLQENPTHTLADAKKALQEAVELDDASPAATIELGHFLDAVEDNPRAAVKEFSKAAAASCQLLVQALLGQASVLLELGKKSEAIECLAEVIQLRNKHLSGQKNQSRNARDRLPANDRHGAVFPDPENGPFADQIKALLEEIR